MVDPNFGPFGPYESCELTQFRRECGGYQNDLEGALKYLEWFSKEYEDDCGEPYQYLCWTLALFKKIQAIYGSKPLPDPVATWLISQKT